jgi:hypothetical protein
MVMDSSGYSEITSAAGTLLSTRNGPLRFYTGSGSGVQERMQINALGQVGTRTDAMIVNAAGNVGIGTMSPTARLDVAGGNLNLDGTAGASPTGVITKGGMPFIHNFNYGNNGTVTTTGRTLG